MKSAAAFGNNRKADVTRQEQAVHSQSSLMKQINAGSGLA
jgi:hypothetical protein